MSDAMPPEALLAIQNGNKVEAIKALREAQGLELKEAKDRVEAYIHAHPESWPHPIESTGGNVLRYFLLAVALVVIWLLFKVLEAH